MHEKGQWEKMKHKLFGALIIVSSVAALLVIIIYTGSLEAGSNTYVGTLKEGHEYAPFGGEPFVELIFEDGREFAAPWQMAVDAEMKVGNTYKITFNIEDPNVALAIKGVD
jgi:hypothetical protein